GLTPWASWITDFRAQYPAYRYPCPTLQVQPHDCPRMARARAARYSFPVRLLHSLLNAGLSRRYPDQGVCPTNSAIPGKVCDIALKRAPREARRPVLGRLRYLRSGVGDGLSIGHPARARRVGLL